MSDYGDDDMGGNAGGYSLQMPHHGLDAPGAF